MTVSPLEKGKNINISRLDRQGGKRERFFHPFRAYGHTSIEQGVYTKEPQNRQAFNSVLYNNFFDSRR